MILHLVLTYHWYDEYLANRKLVEYRKMTPHWKRLIWDRRDRITHVCFHRGYTSTSITVPVKEIDIGPCPYEGWSGEFYRIHVEVQFSEWCEQFWALCVKHDWPFDEVNAEVYRDYYDDGYSPREALEKDVSYAM